MGEWDRTFLASLTGIDSRLKVKLLTEAAVFTVADLVILLRATADALPDADPYDQGTLLVILIYLRECVDKRLAWAPRQSPN